MDDPKADCSYLSDLPKANSIRNKTAVPPKSIFPLLPLPSFKYSEELVGLATPFCVKEQKQLHLLTETSLSKLFSSPIYQSNTRLNLQATNLRFGCIRALYSESTAYAALQERESQEEGLVFESRFESGNMALVARGQRQGEYNILLQKDINTTRCTQWFFFRVQNRKFRGKARFNILNLLKSYSSYENGMKISLCSQSNQFTWTRGCEEIRYLKNDIKTVGQNTYHTLSFTYEFAIENDVTYFAHCPPYTFSMLDSYLLKITNNPDFTPIFKRKTLTETPGGNYVELVTITNFKAKGVKKEVFITARVHPGETPSSFVCEGIMSFLLSSCEEARKLRDQFVFKIVPMLNPDGVINGNYRCSLSGYDLNRVWHYDNRASSPQIYYTKRCIQEQERCFMFIDLHAHSKKKGVFMYGCQNRSNPFLSRHIPYLFSKEISAFNYYQCNFGMRIGREGTSRLTVHHLLRLPYSYTMEHSFCSPIKDKHHFTPKLYLSIGSDICLTLRKYFCCREDLPMETLKQLYSSKELAAVGCGEEGESSDDSELDEPTQFRQVSLQSSPTKVFRRKQSSTFRPRGTDMSLQSTSKLLDKKLDKQIVNEISPSRLSQSNGFRPFLSRNLDSKSKKIGNQQPSVELLVPKQIEVKGQQVFLSSRISELQKETFISKIAGSQHFVMNATTRYQFQEMQSLNNLFLPSLTSASYKRYAKKKNYTNQVIQVGKKYLEAHGLLKEQIRSVSRKKPGWKEQIISYI